MKTAYKVALCLASLANMVDAKCGRTSIWKAGENEHKMIVNDPIFGETEREFVINIPDTYDQNKKTALFFYMHSQGESGIENAHYRKQGKEHNVITVYPQAMADWEWRWRPYPGWNVPMPNNNTEACTPTTNIYCYRSCESLGRCGQCAWSTCYDDIVFMRSMLNKIKDELCINDDLIYVAGCSNGGMFSYYLSQQMPEVFRGYIIESAQPLIGQMYTPAAVKGKSYLTLHGRQDQTIPLNGGVDGSNEWIFYSVEQMTDEWAKVQGCDMSSYERVVTPYDNEVKHQYTKGYNLKCFEYTKGCAARVINCEYYGTHSNYASFDAKLAYWFFSAELGIETAELDGKTAEASQEALAGETQHEETSFFQ